VEVLWAAKSLLKNPGNNYEYYFILPSYSTWKVKVTGIPVEGTIRYVYVVTTKADREIWKKLKNILLSLRDAYKTIKSVNPSAVIYVGTSIAVPLCFWAKYFRKKAIFIESITHVIKPSLTGKILSILRLCDRFYVQWPEAVKLYRGAVYKGTVL
jgi:UDP-N-acetylglucosamine:LPS N-acetylglucosamine transferase